VRELYLMALYATRAREESAGEASSEGEHEVALRVALVVGRDEAEARARARSRLFELCPPEDGWVNHHVVASALGRDELRAVLESLSEEEDAEGGPPDLIM
jgi:alkanesulfonate monooxygenase SsuD/methylene tetrahydromethanopterin reductase-like flavin-dependent oxidoreductase (luciferase family)